MDLTLSLRGHRRCSTSLDLDRRGDPVGDRKGRRGIEVRTIPLPKVDDLLLRNGVQRDSIGHDEFQQL